ncbi:Ribonucleotide-diphosphate reductase subunit [Komagataella phaffii CBS 7435]|uniref:Ribonucleoside-diphosphate reductase n=2 Tax=Komagataella phaffii TaxID=460519 RepID=C4QZZ3_KOMPG|nr:One of two large regulatory subunits of ribonucleotide-diphosphate reductase [Komagataella phaffii GS115]AOA62354.1 GQ67_00237T0 [Komagataella phaffii]CAH2448682.1 Ribonucleotide-diphosphate reductase subunit [Komagataella phaffii CBS 7435]AOA67742.1 GQ68_01151T0 [Komagataella phaffii GS115]CAY68817.1 One of two large regulatory subunits of ribonucleotide-diphosphate reductase [Komagataella phaffii GS115]CCA38775.1 Ribonucleotide-diphosphate reductase subunit [Komagataella phaffii CBS 7435]
MTKSKEAISFDEARLKRSLLKLSFGLNLKFVDIALVVEKVSLAIIENLHLQDLLNLTSEILASLSTRHYDYSNLAARLLSNHLRKRLGDSFFANCERLAEHGFVDKGLLTIARSNSEQLDGSIKPERDFDFDYFGYMTLQSIYLLKKDDLILETPQFLFMRVALGIHGEDLSSAIQTYDLMSQGYFIHASPTLFHAGTPTPYLSSCFLMGLQDADVNSVYQSLHKIAMISNAAGGIGINVHDIPAEDACNRGIVPLIKVLNETARYVQQGSNKRPSAFAIYLEPWHEEVFDLLNLRKNHGKEEIRARDLFYALWIPDLFMEKVEKNEDWCLFNPLHAKGLNDVYGEQFNLLYAEYEKKGMYVRKIPAQQLWNAIVDAQIETGTPFMLYKDSCNRKSNQSNLGTIQCSNLCCEIVEYSSRDQIAVCNLASIGLPKYVVDGKFDFESLKNSVRIVTENLNKVIDISKYPVPEASYSNDLTRPMAIGVQGLWDTFMLLKIPYDSEEAAALNSQIFETIYYSALETSMNIAKKDGPYKSFQGSPASKGLLQMDLWNVKEEDLTLDWKSLRSDIVKHGLRNSLLVGPMPTASTSQILGFCESFEPLSYNFYTRRVSSGEYQVVNKYLIDDLINLGLWTDSLRQEIIGNDGSIQEIDEIPQEVKSLYKTVWEISQRITINMAADRGRFIDQSQSMNLYLAKPNRGKLTAMHFYAWKKGLKTGMYYLRTKAASSAIKFSIDISKRKRDGTYNTPTKRQAVQSEALETTPSCQLNNCESCSG